MRIGFDALAVENGGRGARLLALASAVQSSQSGIEALPKVVACPSPKDVVNRLPRRKVSGQRGSRITRLLDVEQGVQEAAQIRTWPTATPGSKQHRFRQLPLGIGQIGRIDSGFIAPTGVPLAGANPPLI